MKQSSLDDQEALGMEWKIPMPSENGDKITDIEYDKRRPSDNNEASQTFNSHILNMYNVQVSPPPQDNAPIAKGLPCKPKV